ncbi:MAG: hypothetical protein HUU20_29400 [Pirellulales bacterium]|nr:hypothetical protein [Pirellulales bacterium]
MQRKVTVFDSRSNDLALAAELAGAGCQVMLYEHADSAMSLGTSPGEGTIAAVPESARAAAAAARAGSKGLAGLTNDMAEAISFSEVLIFALPLHAQEPIFRIALPHFRSGQTVVLVPGSFGSFVLRHLLAQAEPERDLRIVETAPRSLRNCPAAPDKVLSDRLPRALQIAALPAWQSGDVLDVLNRVLPVELSRVDNALEAAFSDPTAILRTATAVIAQRQADGGPNPAGATDEVISRVLRSMDSERRRIGRELGLRLEPFAALDHRIPRSAGTDPSVTAKDEGSCWLLPVLQFGELVGVEAPVMESVLTLLSIAGKTDCFQHGRTLQRMGLDGLTPEEILACTLDDQYAGSAMYPR